MLYRINIFCIIPDFLFYWLLGIAGWKLGFLSQMGEIGGDSPRFGGSI